MTQLISRNPYTGEQLNTYNTITDNQLITYIERAESSFIERSQRPIAERASYFYALADLLDERNKHYAKLETLEMGRLYSAALK